MACLINESVVCIKDLVPGNGLRGMTYRIEGYDSRTHQIKLKGIANKQHAEDYLLFPSLNPIPETTRNFETMSKKSDGGSTNYYKIPEGARDLQDLIEFKKMNFGRGNIFKASYRLGEDGNDELYDLNKIVWFAERRIKELDPGYRERVQPHDVVEQGWRVPFKNGQANLKGYKRMELCFKHHPGGVFTYPVEWCEKHLDWDEVVKWRPEVRG